VGLPEGLVIFFFKDTFVFPFIKRVLENFALSNLTTPQQKKFKEHRKAPPT
jgi:hypothetical protein